MSNRAPDIETIGGLLRETRDTLGHAGIDQPELEAELLLRQALRGAGAPLPSKAWLLARLGQAAAGPLRQTLAGLLKRRLAHEPAAYITGVREFFALEFEVTPDVLIPRPETEGLVVAAIEWATGGGMYNPLPSPDRLPDPAHQPRSRPLRIVDAGTGSGAIAVALAKSLPAATVTATDVSWDALAVARRNAASHGVEARISFRHGDLLLPVSCYADLVVANLPYVGTEDWRGLASEVRDHEPPAALLAGEDGLDVIRALLHQAPRYLRPGSAICLEFGAGQANALLAAVEASLPRAATTIHPDFAGLPRVLVAQL